MMRVTHRIRVTELTNLSFTVHCDHFPLYEPFFGEAICTTNEEWGGNLAGSIKNVKIVYIVKISTI